MYGSIKVGKANVAFVNEFAAVNEYRFEMHKNRQNLLPCCAEIVISSNDVDVLYKRAIDAGAVALVGPAGR
jgi:hypothetical protein